MLTFSNFYIPNISFLKTLTHQVSVAQPANANWVLPGYLTFTFFTDTEHFWLINKVSYCYSCICPCVHPSIYVVRNTDRRTKTRTPVHIAHYMLCYASSDPTKQNLLCVVPFTWVNFAFFTLDVEKENEERTRSLLGSIFWRNFGKSFVGQHNRQSKCSAWPTWSTRLSY